ncbi:uncharacterized protein LOC123554208 [Mercenaria mercenaria]|uniref:uncharacterized protein LOC123554208 n=1 Tax=Mercenaria mercenaria TaxID=6596 RepID=UPI00234F5BF2|nr:uncharacterized protein LOC123554208 [Mercenaria mercenaria]
MTEHEPKTNIDVNGESLYKEKEFKQNSVDKDTGIGEKQSERAIEDDHGGAPIDRGWAWVVLAACVFEIIVYGGLLRSFGVFFLQYQKRFNSNASETAFMSLIQNVVLSITVLFVMTIGLKHFSSRVAVFTGGVFTVAAYLITAFATDIRVFYFAQGVLGGVGLAMIHPPMLAIIGVYFHKHRGLANSVFNGGGSVGGLIFAPLIIKLFDEYQFTGAMLIFAGLLMNICVSALLMRPIESYSKERLKYRKDDTEITENDKLLSKNEIDKNNIDSTKLTFDEIKLESDSSLSDSIAHENLRKYPAGKGTNFTRMQSYDPVIVNGRPKESPLLQRVRAHSFGIRQRTISEDKQRYDSDSNIHHSKNVLKGVIDAISRSQLALYASGEGFCGSVVDLSIPSSRERSRDNDASSGNKINDSNEVGCFSNMKACILSVLCTVFDLGLLRNPVFIAYLLMAFSIMSGVALVPVYIPPHAKDIGISNEKIGLMLSLMAVIDLVSKVTMGVFADRKWIKTSTILVIVTFVLGTASHLLCFVDSFPAMIIFVVVAGICCGQYMSLYAVLLMEVIGPEKFKSSIGFGTLVHGASIAIFFPVAGLLRDVTGSYVASFHLLGGLAYLAGILAFIIPIVNRWKKRKEADKFKDQSHKKVLRLSSTPVKADNTQASSVIDNIDDEEADLSGYFGDKHMFEAYVGTQTNDCLKMTELKATAKAEINGETFNTVKEVDQASADGDSGIEEEEIDGAFKDAQNGAPVDRGWAWVVLAACVLEIIVYGGMIRSFGVFFLQYQMRFKSNASETAVMSLIQNVVLSITALFVMTIGLKKFSSRVSVFTGGTFTVAAYLITAFATDIRVFYFAQGVLGGVGLAMIVPPMLAIIGVYFNKHRGLANSIFTAGGSVGGLIFAPVTVKLFDEFQYTGAILIISGLLMNIWVSALLMRPIESYSKKKTHLKDKDTNITEDGKLLLKENTEKHYIGSTKLTFDEIKLESDVFHSDVKSQSDLLNHSHVKTTNFTRMQSYDPGMVNQISQGSPLLFRVRAHSFGNLKRTISDDKHRYEKYDSQSNINHIKNVLKGVIDAISRSQVALYTNSGGICGSFIDLNIPPTEESSKDYVVISDKDTIDTKVNEVECCSNIKSCIFSVLCTVFDLGLLRNPVFITYLLMAFFMMSGLLLVPVYIPTHAKDIGISNEKIGLLISLMAVIDLVSKVTMGVVADRQWIKRSTILVIATFVLGTASHLMRFVNSFPTMIIFTVIAGACCGQYMSVYAVLLMEVIGPEKFKSSLGFGTLVHGTSIAVFFPVAGLLRDVTGSYVATFHLLGGLAYLAGVLAFIIPIVNKMKWGKEAEEIKDPANEA